MRRLLALALLAAAPALALEAQPRTLDVDGARLDYLLRTHPPDAHLQDTSTPIAPTSALNTAKLINRHLAAGEIEEAALLSNAPRRRYEVFRDYRSSIGEEEFRRVFAQYFFPENRLLAEVAIGRHRLLIWRLKHGEHLAGQYFVEVEGKFLMDDTPSETRASLRRILEAYRSGKIRSSD